VRRLHISPIDFLKLLRAAHAINGRSAAGAARGVARLGAYIRAQPVGIYGGVFDGLDGVQPRRADRKKRALRAGPRGPRPGHSRATALRLTRYPGGAKGPVVSRTTRRVEPDVRARHESRTQPARCLFERATTSGCSTPDRARLPPTDQRYSTDDIARVGLSGAVAHVRAASAARTRVQ